jgi:hypothetical protein
VSGSGQPHEPKKSVEELLAAVGRHYTRVCYCEWSEDDFTRTMTRDNCSMHGNVLDPMIEVERRLREAARA